MTWRNEYSREDLDDEEKAALSRLYGNCASWVYIKKSDAICRMQRVLDMSVVRSLKDKGLIYAQCSLSASSLAARGDVMPLLTTDGKSSFKHGKWEEIPGASTMGNVMDKMSLKVIATVIASKMGCKEDIDALVEETFAEIAKVQMWSEAVKLRAGHYKFKGYEIVKRNVVGTSNHSKVEVWQIKCLGEEDSHGKITATFGTAKTWITDHGKVPVPTGL